MPENNPVILFDASRLINRLLTGSPTGIDRVDLEYCRHFLSSKAFRVAFVAYGKRGHFILPKIFISFVLNRSFSARMPTGKNFHFMGFIGSRVIYQLFKLLRWTSVLGFPQHPLIYLKRLNASAVYINASHGKMTKPYRFNWLKKGNVKAVFFVHDLIPIQFPQYCTHKQEKRHRLRLKTISMFANRVIAISEDTRSELINYLRKENLPLPQVSVLPLGVDGVCDAEISEYVEKADVPYFVVLSTIEPRKNHALLLRIWQRLIGDYGDNAPILKIIGRRGWENEEVFNLLDSGILRSDKVLEFSGLTDTEVKMSLLGARALLSPSFIEGYGLPVVESLSLGVPVLASDIPAHHEVGQGVAELLKPEDEESWYQAIISYMSTDSVRRQIQVEKMNNYERPTWHEHLKELDQILVDLFLKSKVL